MDLEARGEGDGLGRVLGYFPGLIRAVEEEGAGGHGEEGKVDRSRRIQSLWRE